MSIDPALIERVYAGFVQAFGRPPTLIVHAPGRVNLIGEHTDYNDGFVLPVAIPVGTAIALGPRADRQLVAVALDLGEARTEIALDQIIEPGPVGDWSNHLRGISVGLSQLPEADHFACPAADIAIAGNVPQGAGLSSSASLSVALGLGLSALAGKQLADPLWLARLAQWSEHHFAGCACGIMDQLAATAGKADHALLIDCRSLDVDPVPLPPDLTIIIAHSGVSRGLVDSAYNERRLQCELAARHYGVPALRDLDAAALETGKAGLDPVAYRRARHVVSENARALLAAAALQSADLVALGALLRASHASLRDDFEVTVPAVDDLVDSLNAVIGSEGGARMTGGGFGGCVVALVPAARAAFIEAAITDHFRSHGAEPGLVMRASAAEGAGQIDWSQSRPRAR